MKRILTTLILLLCFTTQWSYAGLAEQLFEAGNKAYLEGDWDEALKSYRQIESSGYIGGELYYNMGNACFQTNRLGEAILYWERASTLLIDKADVTHNLEIARKRLVDKLDDEVRLAVWDWFDDFRSRFSTELLSWGAILLSFLLFAFVSLKRWVWRSAAIFKYSIMLSLTLLIVNVSLLYLEARDENINRYCVFVVPEAEVLSAPAAGTGKMLFSLHEGTKVRIVRQVDDWFEIDAGKQRQGWVKSNAVGVI